MSLTPSSFLATTTDPGFPAVHPRPAQGWLNDPNGLCYADGRWHVFFQYNPYSARHADIHWGHISSPDLVNWTVEPVALAPRPNGPDSAGCWSGVMTFNQGHPVAVYSGVEQMDNTSQVTLAYGSEDLRAFSDQRIIAASVPEDNEVTAVRDPFIFHHHGKRWALQGAGLRNGHAAILLYDATDLHHWEYLGVWLSSAQAPEEAAAEIWECPQLFQAEDERWVLIVSRWRRQPDGAHELVDTRALVLRLQLPTSDDEMFIPAPEVLGWSTVDEGEPFYAPQILSLEDRTLLIGWVREERDQAACDIAGWSGLLTWPRELELTAQHQVVSRPAAECTGWRRSAGRFHPGGEAVRVDQATEIELETPGAGDVSLQMLSTENGSVARTVYSGPASRIIIDHSVVEIYRAQGAPVTLRVEPVQHQQWLVNASHSGITCWELGPSTLE